MARALAGDECALDREVAKLSAATCACIFRFGGRRRTCADRINECGESYRNRTDLRKVVRTFKLSYGKFANNNSVARMALRKQKARLSAGLRGEKAPRPLRGRPQNPFLDRSLVRAKEISQAGKALFDSVVSQ